MSEHAPDRSEGELDHQQAAAAIPADPQVTDITPSEMAADKNAASDPSTTTDTDKTPPHVSGTGVLSVSDHQKKDTPGPVKPVDDPPSDWFGVPEETSKPPPDEDDGDPPPEYQEVEI